MSQSKVTVNVQTVVPLTGRRHILHEQCMYADFAKQRDKWRKIPEITKKTNLCTFYSLYVSLLMQ